MMPGVHPIGGPPAFSGSRLGWGDLPRHVRARISELAGAAVVTEASATSGFSPGYAASLELGDGTRLFLKAVSTEQNPDSPALARAEIRHNRLLPPEVDAPRLVFGDDDGTWVLLGFESVVGFPPGTPWEPGDLDLALRALTRLAAVPAPDGLPALTSTFDAVADGWTSLLDDATARERMLRAVSPHSAWVADRLTDLAVLERTAPDRLDGTALVHGDLRADNLMIAPGPPAQVRFIDWPHAARGAPWFDLVAMLPSVAMQGGGDPVTILAEHPVGRAADAADVHAVVTALAGFFLHRAVLPAPRGLPNLRPFQLAQGLATLAWLRRMAP